MSEFSEKMGMAAGNNFKSGYNCCEAIVQTFRKEAGVNIDDNAFRLCSGFGGGIGHAWIDITDVFQLMSDILQFVKYAVVVS